MGFQSNMEFNVNAEMESAEILKHFNSDFIFDVMKGAIDNRLNFSAILPTSNIIGAFEQNFKHMKNNYIGDVENINQVRSRVYKQSIDIICQSYNLEFKDDDNVDYYSIAYKLYDIFVANYKSYIIYFFSNYLYKEKNGLYEGLGLEELKKNKDSSTMYGKKIYKDVKLAVINANLDYVLKNICVFDISFEDILNIIIGDKNNITFISQYIFPNGDIYKESFCGAFQSPYYPELLTSIRFEIQKMSI